MSAKPVILFETEGSYPYHSGGVSTWSHILCSELEQEVDFIILSITANPFPQSRYRLPNSVKGIIHIPVWGSEEPVQHYEKALPFSDHVARKARTTGETIEKLFLPLFRHFMDCLFNPYSPADRVGELLYGFWKYYRRFDYKKTLAHRLVWQEFKNRIYGQYHHFEGITEERPTMFDVTFGMRWLYHFMMPLAVPVPPVSITHATMAGFPTIASVVAKYEYGIPILLTDHGVYIRERLINVGRSEFPFFSKKLLVDLSTLVTRTVYHHADIIAPVTSVNKKWEIEFDGAEERIRPIYNGVDTDVFRPAPKPGHTAHFPTVVAAAQLIPLKDIQTMIRSCHLVRREIPDVRYILYGSPDVDPVYAETCRKLVQDLNLEKHFIFGGFHETPSEIYTEGDISILSSISEGFPYTVLESMSCCRPVVSTDVGGIREALQGCGILCKPGDARALADGVIQLLKDDNLRIEMGLDGRNRVREHYTIKKTVQNYAGVYQQLHRQEREPLKHNVAIPAVRRLMEMAEGRYV